MDNPFKTYLIQRGFRPQTIYGYTNKLQDYLNWCKEQNYNPKTTTLDDLYDYKNHCLERRLSLQTTRQLLSVLKHYFASINREDNPALMIKHAKRETTLPNHLLSEIELKDLYRNTQTTTLTGKRNRLTVT